MLSQGITALWSALFNMASSEFFRVDFNIMLLLSQWWMEQICVWQGCLCLALWHTVKNLVVLCHCSNVALLQLCNNRARLCMWLPAKLHVTCDTNCCNRKKTCQVWLIKPSCRASLCNSDRKTRWGIPVGPCKFGGTRSRISVGTGPWMTYNSKFKTAFLCVWVGSSHRQCKPSSFQKCWCHCRMSIGPGRR